MIKRLFSTGVPAAREYAHIVRRRVKAPRKVSVGDPSTLLPRNVPAVPPYPYGNSTVYKQSDQGLYGGKLLQFGHQISEYGNKHVRVFRPNVQPVTLWSDVLNKKVRIRVVASVLKTITREGGLDNYLLKDTAARIKELGPAGWALRYQVLQRIEEHERTQSRPVDTVNGVPIYAKVTINGSPKGVTAGRTKLVKLLFGSSDGAVPLKTFMETHRDLSFQDLLQKLEQAGIGASQYLIDV